MKHRRVALALAALTVGALAAACVPATPAPTPPPLPQLPAPPPVVTPPTPAPVTGAANYSDVLTGLDQPWDIAFQPVGTGSVEDLVFTESNSAKISAIVNGVRKDLTTVPGVDTTGEGGLMGLAFHPSYPTDSRVYFCYSTSSDNRVAYATVTRDGSGHPLSIGAPTNIVTGIPHAGFHNGCRVRFQPGSGALFVTTGDAAVGPGPQGDASLAGKILRLTDAGQPYAGNANNLPWYSKGHRNPQGLAFRPGSNEPYTAEHGPNINDEVNHLVNGGNAGWDPTNGADYDQTKPMTDLVKFPGAVRPVWRSGDAGTIAPSGITFLSGAQWKAWDGALVLAVLKNSELRVLLMNPDGTVSGQFQMPGSAGTRLRSAVQGPDGNLYVATDVAGTGRIFKVTPTP